MEEATYSTVDELEIAARIEDKNREFALKQLLHNIVSEERDIESLIDEDLRCEECNNLIPTARQRAILKTYKTCEYCVECQSDIEKKDKLYW